MYKSCATDFIFDKGLSNPRNALSDETVAPKSISSNNPLKSPNLTLEFTTPSFKSFLYKSFCFLVPFKLVCNAWYESLIAPGVGIIPFAVAKAPALTKFLACVIGDKIVLAICDVAFGYNINPSYICAPVPLAAPCLFVSSNASAISSIAYLPFKGFVIPAS